MIPRPARDVIARPPLGFVATITPDGQPAVSPKGTFLVLDDATIGFGNIRSPGTLANLAARPGVEVCFVDPFTRKGARLSIQPVDPEHFEHVLALGRAAG